MSISTVFLISAKNSKVRQDINDGKSGSAGTKQKQNEDEWDYVALVEKMRQAEAKAYLGGKE